MNRTHRDNLCPRSKEPSTFENVEFEYDKDVPVLKGVSFHAEAGATTAWLDRVVRGNLRF
jgi:ABC-type transport system involved in Fe-S cluster assembly fused permease/ATPase subunit